MSSTEEVLAEEADMNGDTSRGLFFGGDGGEQS